MPTVGKGKKKKKFPYTKKGEEAATKYAKKTGKKIKKKRYA
jgi:hypothetical protein|tara:strand:- start:2133 stop:2255 length:123 start_codon:yes stop_codon:yes gene_type:complete